jgi:putative membrane protein
MRKIKDFFLIAVKGACMGAADVIPGVSGGTIAFIMGIYDEFVGSIARIDSEAVRLLLKGQFREFWKHINGSFLLSLIAGIGASVICLAGLMQMLLSDFPIQTWAFFFGLIVASSIFILRGISGWHFREGLFLVLGVILGVTVCTLSPTQTPEALWFVFLSGAIAICAMILPGISGSFILLILGKYQFIMSNITACVTNIGALWGASGADAATFWSAAVVIAIFLVGAVCGIIGFSKFLHWLLARWHKETLIVLAGFIIGSLVKVWPWSNMDAIVCSQFPEVDPMNEAMIQTLYSSVDLHIGGAIIFALIGFSLVSGIEIAGKIIGQKN